MADEPFEIELTIVGAPSAPEPPPSRKRLRVGSRWREAVAVAVVATVGVAGFVLVRDQGPDPDAVLQDARAAVADVRGFEFRLEAAESQSTGGENINTEITERFVTNGKWSDSRWSSRSTTNAVVAELLVDGGITYSRSVTLTGGSVTDQPWLTADTDSPGGDNLIESLSEAGTDEILQGDPGDELLFVDVSSEDERRISAAVDVYLGLRAGGPGARHQPLSRWGYDRSPRDLLGVVEHMRPTGVTEGPDGSVVLTGRLESEERHDVAFGAPLPGSRVVLHLDADRIPTRLKVALRLGHSGFSIDVELKDWSEPVAIDLPASEEIDQTPTVDEEHLVGVAEWMELVWPTAIPAGWEMSSLAVESPDSGGGFASQISTRLCDTVVMEWLEPLPEGTEVEETAGSLRIELTSLSCAYATNTLPFEPDLVWGLPMREGAFGGTELQIGNTAVTVDVWAIDASELDAIMRSFSRVGVDTVLAAAVAAAAG